MFETRPDVLSMFERYRMVDRTHLGDSSSLEIHAMIVMDAIDDVIVNLDDPDYVIETLLAMGRSHRRFNKDNSSPDVFWV